MADIKAMQVRMPAEVHEALKASAFYTERSMNDIAVEALVQYLSNQNNDTLDRITEKARGRYRSVLDKLKDL